MIVMEITKTIIICIHACITCTVFVLFVVLSHVLSKSTPASNHVIILSKKWLQMQMPFSQHDTGMKLQCM